MALPTMTPTQALARAAAARTARTARKQLLDQLKAGKVALADVLARADTDELVKKTRVVAVVKALPGVGTVRAGELGQVRLSAVGHGVVERVHDAAGGPRRDR